jgi:hypothetical protein
MNGGKRTACRILVGKQKAKRPLGRPKFRWMDNIKMDHREIGSNGIDWIDLDENRDWHRALVNMVTKLQVP